MDFLVQHRKGSSIRMNYIFREKKIGITVPINGPIKRTNCEKSLRELRAACNNLVAY